MSTAPQTAQEAAPTRQQEQLAPELVLGMLAQLVLFAQQMQPATRLGRLRGWLATLLHPRRAKPAPDAAARAEILALLAQLNAIATAFSQPAAEPNLGQQAAATPGAAPHLRPEPGQPPAAAKARPATPIRPGHHSATPHRQPPGPPRAGHHPIFVKNRLRALHRPTS